MHDLAFEQIRERGETDVRMRAHVDALRNAGREFDRTEMIEEDERPDAAPLAERQHASHGESAQVAASRIDDEFDHGGLRCRASGEVCAIGIGVTSA